MNEAVLRARAHLISIAKRRGLYVDAQTLKLRALEWGGCGLGLAGAFMLATYSEISRYGWILFLMANFAVIGFAWLIRAYGLLVQQCGFMVTSVLGLVRAFGLHL